MNNNRDLSKILESLQDLQTNTASTEEITVLKEMLSETISTLIALAQQTAVVSTAINKRITLVDEKNDLNLVYFLNDFDSSIESSFGRNNKSRFFDLGTKTTSTDASYKGCHVIVRNNELMNILPRKNFGVVYDWDLIHTVYPFDKNEARLTFVMNIILGKTTNRFGEWEYTNLPHERGYD